MGREAAASERPERRRLFTACSGSLKLLRLDPVAQPSQLDGETIPTAAETPVPLFTI